MHTNSKPVRLSILGERLIPATKTSSSQKFIGVFGLSKSTIDTWCHRNLIQYEIVARLYLEIGILIRRFTLSEGEPYEASLDHTLISEGKDFDANCFRIEDGQLANKESRQAVSGTYRVDMDDQLSLADIQRVLGKKMTFSFR